jgi:hypothetical protein
VSLFGGTSETKFQQVGIAIEEEAFEWLSNMTKRCQNKTQIYNAKSMAFEQAIQRLTFVQARQRLIQ